MTQPGPDLETLRRLIDRLQVLTSADWDRIRDAVKSERDLGIDARWRHARRRTLWLSPWRPRFRLLAQLAFMGGEPLASIRVTPT